jgi:hypothetical protein
MRIEPASFLALTAAMARVDRALVCLPEMCNVTACLDDWISIWSY